MAKTTKAHFELFKVKAQRWVDVLGLKDWAVYYDHDKLEGSYATTRWSTDGNVATITLGTSWDQFMPVNGDNLDRVALHEVLHIVLAPLISEAEYRYSTQAAIDTAEHAIIRRLEKLCV